jgi:AraC family L-rhamnose operon transcriptional activator RhaR
MEGPVASVVRSLATRQGLAELTPGGVASVLGRTLDHLNRQLRAEAGTTTGGLLNRLRLDEASRRLRESEQSIGEIAAAIGMDDQNYFARWFRRQTGQTPTRWRAAMR